MSQITHRSDSTGRMVQIVTPEELRRVLDQDGDTYDRPTSFGDRDEWNVALHPDEIESVHCECGEATGVYCEWTGPEAETVVVEYMPTDLRASHEAAGNSGRYPHNGAIRLRVERSCGELLVESEDDWAKIVG